jgi:hypothetical protein
LSKSFLLLFFKKEGLPAACLTCGRLPGQLPGTGRTVVSILRPAGHPTVCPRPAPIARPYRAAQCTTLWRTFGGHQWNACRFNRSNADPGRSGWTWNTAPGRWRLRDFEFRLCLDRPGQGLRHSKCCLGQRW